jgi:hypothetical protein
MIDNPSSSSFLKKNQSSVTSSGYHHHNLTVEEDDHNHLVLKDNPMGILRKDSFDSYMRRRGHFDVVDNLLSMVILGDILVGKVGLDQHRRTVDKGVDYMPFAAAHGKEKIIVKIMNRSGKGKETALKTED